MPLIADTIFDQALQYIKTNGVEGEIQNASGVALVDAITLNSGNYGTVINNSGAGGGRKLQCFVSDTSDMRNLSVGTGGTATKGAIKDVSGNVLVEADISGDVAVTASDQVNIGTADVILKDPV